MISRRELERLTALQSDEGIVSAYIQIDPRLMHERGHHVAAFKGALKRLGRRTADEHWLAVAEREKGRILKFLEDWQPPSGRGLVIFSCQPDGIWEVINLNVPVPTSINVDNTARTEILAQVLDEYPRFVVAFVQRDKASIYTTMQRTSREEVKIASGVPGQHDEGGWSQARYQRHIEFHVQQHLKQVADELERLYYERPFNRLAIGGPHEVVSEVLKLLPDQLSRRVIGTFAVDFKHVSEEEMLEQASRVLEEDERRSERELVERVVNLARAGGSGVVGIDETLNALIEERVHTLLLADGATKEGSICLTCSYLSTSEFDRCPVCGGEAEFSPEIVEEAVERALLQGAHIEAVFGEARDWLLSQGGLAAELRY